MRPLSNSLLGKLQKDILTGKLKAGQKLTEQQLCKEYEVSRTPVTRGAATAGDGRPGGEHPQQRRIRYRHERTGLRGHVRTAKGL